VPSKKLKITLTGSIIGLSPRQEATVKALGLRKRSDQVTHDDTPTIRGMIAKAPHVLTVTHEA
jgi:large subunit ribosomal protein L30